MNDSPAMIHSPQRNEREVRSVEDNKKSSQVEGTTSEELGSFAKDTKVVSSDQLSNLNNIEIAFLLYFLVANGTDKKFEDFYDIGNNLGVIAANLKC